MFTTQSKLLALCLMAAALPLSATTYYFASTGKNTNTCTAPQTPCQSISLSNLTLFSGDSLLSLDGGDISYFQTTIITTGLTIDGGQHGALMTSSLGCCATTVYIQTTNQNVVLRNLTIVANNASNGNVNAVYLQVSGGSVTLENVTILTPDGLVSGGPGTYTGAIGGTVTNGGAVKLRNVTIRGYSTAVNIANSANPTSPFLFQADNLTVDVPQSDGVVLTDAAGTIRNSNFRGTGMTHTGLALLTTTTTPTFLLDGCSFTSLAYGLVTGAGSTTRISNSEFAGNSFGLFGSGTTISFRNNVFAGNGTDGSPSLTTSLK
jgi:hypothetical protein